MAGGHFPLTGGHGFVGRQHKEQRDVGPGTHQAEYLQIHHQTEQEKKIAPRSYTITGSVLDSSNH